jgi:hypothetical protein
MTRPSVVLLVALTAAGCRKPSSPEFFQLEAAQASLLAREGDEALEGNELAGIITRLDAIPADALEKPRAEALVAKLRAAQARARAARVAAEPKAELPAGVGAWGRAAPPATGPSREFLCEWTGTKFRGCALGSFTSLEQATAFCVRGLPRGEEGSWCSCGDSPSAAATELCTQLIAQNRAAGLIP